ncbi:MAG TPA: SPFH domain-containing protein [Candidatus Saccharimonadales bacterium]|jgi:uncharacterized membrane protein YqiK
MDSIPTWAVITVLGFILLVTLLVVIFAVYKMLWKVAAASQALIISGRKRPTEPDEPDSLQFRIVSGNGTLINPLIERVEVLDLSLKKVTPHVKCPTRQGIEVGVKGVVIFKVGDDQRSIANAARRFTGDHGGDMRAEMEDVFGGQLRSIVGGMSVEEMIQDRNALTAQTRQACSAESEALGLVINSLQIQEIEDPSLYVKNIAAPHLARVQSDARIAEAQADEAATAVEQRAEIAKATARRETSIQTAAIQAEVEARQAEASQQGPLAHTRAQQEVLEQEALLAQRQASVREQELNAEVRLVADADAYATTKRAEAARQSAILAAQADAESTRTRGLAQAEADRARGEADADIIRARGEAEGDALKAKAEGVAANQEALLGQMMVEQLPQVVAAAAGMYDNVDTLTVLDGAEGMNKTLMSLMTVGSQAFEVLKGSASKVSVDQVGSTSAASSNGVATQSGDAHVV